MARERMAKLLKYCHFEGRIGDSFINFDIIKICMIMTHIEALFSWFLAFR